MRRRDPFAGGGRLGHGEDPDLAWQEAEDIDRMLYPVNVRYDRHALPAREMFDPDFEILPHRACFHAGEFPTQLVVAVDFRMSLEGQLDSRHEDVLIIALGHNAVGQSATTLSGKSARISIMGRPPALS